MIGSSPIASTPIGDDGGGVVNIELTAANIAAQAPSIANANLSQDHDLSADGFATIPTVVQTVSFTQNFSLTSVNLTFGTPILGGPSITQNHNLVSSNLSFGVPTLGSPSYTEESLLDPDSITTQQPVLDAATLSSSITVQPDDIVTLIPDVGEPVDPNAIVVQEIKEIEQMFGGWPRRAYEVPDGRLVQGEREIEATFGDRVSVDRKAKSLIKFGKSADLAADTLETVWTVGGHETYVTDNTIEYISSSSAADTQTIKIECHTVSGTGADAKFTFLVQEVTLNGQNPVALDTPVARVSHAYNASGTELVGRVTVYENTTVVGGVPSDETKIHLDIPQGLQGSFKGATTFSDSDYYILTGGFGSVSKKQDASVDFYLEVRTAGGVFIQQAAVSATTGGPWDIDLDPAVIIPKNADVRITAETDANNAVVFGVFKGYLAKVLN